MRILLQKVLKIPVLNAVIMNGDLVIVALDVIMHVGARGGGRIAIGVPHVGDLTGSHEIIFILGIILVFSAANDLFDNLISIEFWEVVMIPSGYGHVGSVAVNGINVCRLLELDECIAWMCMFFLKGTAKGTAKGTRRVQLRFRLMIPCLCFVSGH